jgi:hypothetical protein
LPDKTTVWRDSRKNAFLFFGFCWLLRDCPAEPGHLNRLEVPEMKIAQIAPLHESVPPKTYGGTERVVHYLTEALVRQGHEVTLFASGDSQTSADLRAVVPEALRLSQERRDPLAWHML